MKKQDYYTVDTNTIDTNNFDNYNSDFKSGGNSNYTYTFSCQYLLPCGICSRTNNPCPKHFGKYESPIKWNEWTCKTSDFDSSMSNSYTTNVQGDLKSSYTVRQKDLEDFFDEK